MLKVKSGKREKNGRNMTAKFGKYQNASREGKLQALGTIGNERQTNRDEDKKIDKTRERERERGGREMLK